jgi:hypothetical protein
MKYKVIVYGFETYEEAEEARKKAQMEFAKWAAVEGWLE